jgi:hypothetical protein
LQTNTEAVDTCHTDQTWRLVTSTFFQNWRKPLMETYMSQMKG